MNVNTIFWLNLKPSGDGFHCGPEHTVFVATSPRIVLDDKGLTVKGQDIDLSYSREQMGRLCIEVL